MAVGAPSYRYRLRGEYIQSPTTMPRSAAMVPMPDDQMTTVLHWRPCLRSGVKENKCVMGPAYAPSLEARVVYCTTSPDVCETYTCSPFGHVYFQSGCT